MCTLKEDFMWSEQPYDEGVTLLRGSSGISKCIMLQKQQQGNDSTMWACGLMCYLPYLFQVTVI